MRDKSFYMLFESFFDDVATDAHELAIDKGWYDEEMDQLTQWSRFISNLHREASEVWDAYVRGNPQSEKIPEFSSVEEELADVIIRIMDTAKHQGLNVAGAISAKHKYNTSRTYRHGGKLA